MRYIGRHRAPRPLYLRRPVIGGVAAALVVGGPALALTAPSGGSPASHIRPSATSSGTPDTLVPTDGPLPADSPSRTTRTTPPAPRTTTTSRPAYPATTTSTGRGGTTTSTKPRTSTKTTTKPPTSTYKKINVTGVTLANSTVASGDAVSGSVSYTGGKRPYTYQVTPTWLSMSGTGFSGTAPTVTTDTTVTVTVTVSDGQSFDSGTASLTILAPVAAAG